MPAFAGMTEWVRIVRLYIRWSLSSGRPDLPLPQGTYSDPDKLCHIAATAERFMGTRCFRLIDPLSKP